MAGPGVKKQSEAAFILERFRNLGGMIEIETKYDINVKFPVTQFVVCFGFFLILLFSNSAEGLSGADVLEEGGPEAPYPAGAGRLVKMSFRKNCGRWAPGGDPSEFQFIHLPGSRLGPGTGVPAANRHTMKNTQVSTSPIAFPGPWVSMEGRGPRAATCWKPQTSIVAAARGQGWGPQWPQVLGVRVCLHPTKLFFFQDPI